MIVADTGALLALLNADDIHHRRMNEEFERTGQKWVIPIL